MIARYIQVRSLAKTTDESTQEEKETCNFQLREHANSELLMLKYLIIERYKEKCLLF